MIKKSVIETVLKRCMDLKENENCLVVSDPDTEAIAKPFHEVAKSITSSSNIIIMPTRKNHGDDQ